MHSLLQKSLADILMVVAGLVSAIARDDDLVMETAEQAQVWDK
jgi:hypothetical protein